MYDVAPQEKMVSKKLRGPCAPCVNKYDRGGKRLFAKFKKNRCEPLGRNVDNVRKRVPFCKVRARSRAHAVNLVRDLVGTFASSCANSRKSRECHGWFHEPRGNLLSARLAERFYY